MRLIIALPRTPSLKTVSLAARIRVEPDYQFNHSICTFCEVEEQR